MGQIMASKPKRTETITNLLKDTGSSLHPSTVNQIMLKAGLAEMAEYLSTTGSGEVKSFLKLNEAGGRFGENKWTAHPIKTSVRLYPEQFPELLALVLQGLVSELEPVIKQSRP